MKKILVPYDFTEIAEKGLLLALHLAKRTAAQIYLVHFLPEPYKSSISITGDVSKKTDDEMSLYNIERIKQAENTLQARAGSFQQDGYRVHYLVDNAGFTEGIQSFVQSQGIDLVVMGTSGEQSMAEQFTGNHVEKAIVEVDCPVISVKGNFNLSNVGKIVLAMEEIPVKDPHGHFAFLKSFCKVMQATIHIALVTDRILESKQVSEIHHKLDLLAIERGIDDYSVSVISHRNETEGIIQFAQKIQAGFIAIIKRSEAGYLRFFTSYFSDEMVKVAEMPVITLHFVEDKVKK